MRKTNLTSLVAALAIASSLTLTGCGGGSDTPPPAAQNNDDNIDDYEYDLSYIHASETDEYKNKTVDPYPNAPAVSQEQMDAYLQAINEQRAKGADCNTRGVFPAAMPLVWNNKLYLSAQEHNYDMINATEVVGVDDDLEGEGYIGHGGSGTDTDWTATVWGLENTRSTHRQRAYNNGYDHIDTLDNLARYSKNLVSENPTELEIARYAVNLWMNSDGHCAAIMYALYYDEDKEREMQGEMGMGYMENSALDSYSWVYAIGYK